MAKLSDFISFTYENNESFYRDEMVGSKLSMFECEPVGSTLDIKIYLEDISIFDEVNKNTNFFDKIGFCDLYKYICDKIYAATKSFRTEVARIIQSNHCYINTKSKENHIEIRLPKRIFENPQNN